MTWERVPLGVLQQQVWARDAETYAQLKNHKQRGIEEKESQKWLLSLESVNTAWQANPNTHFVSIGDREADVYDLFLAERLKRLLALFSVVAWRILYACWSTLFQTHLAPSCLKMESGKPCTVQSIKPPALLTHHKACEWSPVWEGFWVEMVTASQV
jgi:hypothetical protein